MRVSRKVDLSLKVDLKLRSTIIKILTKNMYMCGLIKSVEIGFIIERLMIRRCQRKRKLDCNYTGKSLSILIMQ